MIDPTPLTPNATLRLRQVPPAHGLLWVRQGLRAFRKQPMAFAALFAAFMFAVFVLALLPVVGSVLALALLPLVTFGFMNATRIALAGGFPTARVFSDALRGNRTRALALLRLGLVYAVTTFLVMWLSDWFDGGAFEALMQAAPAGDKPTPGGLANRLAAPGLASGMVLRFGLAGLIAVPFWHAPALVVWGAQGAAQSLFSSTLACWRNRGAFAVYMLAWVAIILLFATLGSLVFSLVGAPRLFAVAVVPMSLLFTTVFYVSLYFTFFDCFEASAASPAPTSPEPESPP